MKTAAISVEQMWRMVDAAVSGFDLVPGPKSPPQFAMEDAICTARREGELDLALALVCIHCARAEGPIELRAVLTGLVGRFIETHPGAM